MSAPSLLRSACISNGSSAGLRWRHQWEHRCWKMSLSCSTDWNKWDWTVSGRTFASTCLQYRNKTHRSGHKVTGICRWDELTAAASQLSLPGLVPSLFSFLHNGFCQQQMSSLTLERGCTRGLEISTYIHSGKLHPQRFSLLPLDWWFSQAPFIHSTLLISWPF